MMLAVLLMVAADPMQDLLAVDLRVARIGERLARAGGCDGVLSAPGWIVQDRAQYLPKLRAQAVASLKLGEAPTIVALLPDGAAARAGLRAGDEVLAVDGRAVSGVRGKAYARLGAIDDAIEAGLRAGSTRVRIRRAGTEQEVAIAAERGCPSRFQLLPGRALNAEADGRYVQVSGGIAEFAQSDDELALVIAHELAHNILGHRAQIKARQTRTRDAEREADLKGLQLMAAAGFDPGVAPGFWRRLDGRMLPGFLRDGSHPGTRERIAAAQAEIARLKAKP